MKKLSKEEMKKVIGGLMMIDENPCKRSSCPFEWTDDKGKSHTTQGTCKVSVMQDGTELCYCSNGVGICY